LFCERGQALHSHFCPFGDESSQIETSKKPEESDKLKTEDFNQARLNNFISRSLLFFTA
jgi:hypothetical protein